MLPGTGNGVAIILTEARCALVAAGKSGPLGLLPIFRWLSDASPGPITYVVADTCGETHCAGIVFLFWRTTRAFGLDNLRLRLRPQAQFSACLAPNVAKALIAMDGMATEASSVAAHAFVKGLTCAATSASGGTLRLLLILFSSFLVVV
jgi:hypothetical protein